MFGKIKKWVGRWVNSVAIRLSTLIIILLILSFSILLYMNYRNFAMRMESHVRESAEQTSKLIIRSTKMFMLHNSRNDLAKTVHEIASSSDILGIWIYDKQGKVAYSNLEKDVGKLLKSDARQCNFCHKEDKPETRMTTQKKSILLTGKGGRRILEVVSPIKNERTCYTAACHVHPRSTKLLGLLAVQMDLSGLDHRLALMRNRTIGFSLILVLITLALTLWFIYHQIYIPFKSLYQATKEVGGMNLNYRLHIDRHDEFGVLARSFNRMTQRLEEMTQRLEESNQKLQEWSQKLEQRVEEKTRVIKIERTQKKILFMEKMASMGRMAAVVAHEVNNPLAGILATARLGARLLRRGRDDKTIQEVIGELDLIASESTRCGDIVRNLLMFSRRGVIEVKKNNVVEIMQRSVAIVKHSFEMKKVKLIEDYPDGPVMADCVADGVQQMMIALLINAMDAVETGEGEVRVTVKSVPDGPYAVRIEVSDNGCGMSEETSHRIFEPFFTTKTSGAGDSGTGLGLAVVYGVVTNHGGKISVESRLGRGTTFIVDLPDIPPAGLHKLVEVPLEELHSHDNREKGEDNDR